MTTTTTTEATTVADTILAQLGGRRFAAMTGASGFLAGTDKRSLHFRLPTRGARAADGINAVRITLDASDTYTVSFLKIGTARSGFRVTTIREVEWVYASDLRTLFEAVTGLAVSLGTMGR